MTVSVDSTKFSCFEAALEVEEVRNYVSRFLDHMEGKVSEGGNLKDLTSIVKEILESVQLCKLDFKNTDYEKLRNLVHILEVESELNEMISRAQRDQKMTLSSVPFVSFIVTVTSMVVAQLYVNRRFSIFSPSRFSNKALLIGIVVSYSVFLTGVRDAKNSEIQCNQLRIPYLTEKKAIIRQLQGLQKQLSSQTS